MFNQRGFTVAHIFILGAVLLTALIIMDNTPHTSNPAPITNLQPSPTQPTVIQTNPTPEPTYTPIVNPSPSPTDSPLTHDGSRTGKIIGYFERNSGKTIKVYENELLPFTDINGKSGFYTQKDIDFLKKTFGDPNDPIEKCYNPNCGDKQLKRSQCNNPNGGYICCTVLDKNAWLTKSGCDQIQDQLKPKPPTEQEIAEKKAKILSNYQYCVRIAEIAQNDPRFADNAAVYIPKSVSEPSDCSVFLSDVCYYWGPYLSCNGCPPGLDLLCLENPKK